MMHLTLARHQYGALSTLGRLYINGAFECFTLENPWQDNKRRVSCVPEGTYEVKFRLVGGFQTRAREIFPDLHNSIRGMLELQAVPDRDYILIHWGNDPGDTLGCILLGETQSADFVGRSRAAYRKAYPQIAEPLSCGQRVTLEIKGAPIA